MKKLQIALILLALIVPGCAPAPAGDLPSALNESNAVIDTSVFRAIDRELGIACYQFSADTSPFCLKVDLAE